MPGDHRPAGRPEARLITTERGDRPRATATLEVAHEALIRGWPQLRQWIDADRAGPADPPPPDRGGPGMGHAAPEAKEGFSTWAPAWASPLSGPLLTAAS